MRAARSSRPYGVAGRSRDCERGRVFMGSRPSWGQSPAGEIHREQSGEHRDLLRCAGHRIEHRRNETIGHSAGRAIPDRTARERSFLHREVVRTRPHADRSYLPRVSRLSHPARRAAVPNRAIDYDDDQAESGKRADEHGRIYRHSYLYRSERYPNGYFLTSTSGLDRLCDSDLLDREEEFLEPYFDQLQFDPRAASADIPSIPASSEAASLLVERFSVLRQ